MPFYFRKSVNAGPFRFNFSPGGIGVSVGIKGLRVGTGPRGHYVQAGRNGFYYRATLPSSGNRQRFAPLPSGDPVWQENPDDGMIPVTSGDVTEMQDSAFADMLLELNGKSEQLPLSMVLPAFSTAFYIGCILIIGPAAWFTVPTILLAWLAGRWLDSFRRVVVIVYDMEEGLAQVGYAQLCAALDGLAACQGKWHLDAGRSVTGLTMWKREAGASHIVTRKPLTIGYGSPAILKSNITPPAIKLGSRLFYFLPDVLLVRDATGFGAVGYDTLMVSCEQANFIETEGVPGDALISHYTWQHPNKSGGPDLRFRSNRQIPVCRYDALYLHNETGVRELLEFSKLGVARPFAEAIRLSTRNQSLDAAALLPGNGMSATADAPTSPEKTSNAGVILASIAIMAAVSVLFIAVLPRISLEPTKAPAALIGEVPTARQELFVFAAQLNCRKAPKPGSTVVRSYARGDGVIISGREGNWARVEQAASACWVGYRYLSAEKPKAAHTMRSNKRRAKRKH